MRTRTTAWPEGALQALAAARRPLVLTGAGMSAESGIPTFRDALTGHWSKFRPEELATPEAFASNPGRVWDWYESRRDGIRATAPHAGHQALAVLERIWPRLPIVTQNVDGFHQLAGSSSVIELHGNIMRSICSVTRREIDDSALAAGTEHPPRSPHHPDGLARPDVVWFGESLPETALSEAWEAAGRCDVLLSIGTSSLVQPAASLPLVARDAGARVIEINPAPTPLSDMADWCVRDTAGGALTSLVELLDGVASGTNSAGLASGRRRYPLSC